MNGERPPARFGQWRPLMVHFALLGAGPVEPKEEPDQYCLLPRRHGRKGHLGKAGECRHPTGPNCLSSFPWTRCDLLHPRPPFKCSLRLRRAWRTGLNRGRLAQCHASPRAHASRCTRVPVHTRPRARNAPTPGPTCWQPTGGFSQILQLRFKKQCRERGRFLQYRGSS